MTILAVDPRLENLALLTDCIAANHPEAEIQPFADPMLAYQFGANHSVDSVYTLIDMKRLSGFELMKMLRKLYPQVKANYIDKTEQFRRDALRLAAYTYMVEPLTPELMRRAETQAEAYAREDGSFEGA